MNKPSIGQRMHEWAADSFSWVQYPNISGPRPTFFKNQMPPHTRFFLFVFGLLGVGVAAVFIAFLLLLVWSWFTA